MENNRNCAPGGGDEPAETLDATDMPRVRKAHRAEMNMLRCIMKLARWNSQLPKPQSFQYHH